MKSRSKLWLLIVTAALLTVAVACSSAVGSQGVASQEPEVEARANPQAIPTPVPPASFTTPTDLLAFPDISKHTVPLEEIYFDTFDGRSVPLSEASDNLILRLRDAIRPIYQPVYGPAEDGDWMEPEGLVLGYVAADGLAYAYPIAILNFHEIVNDTLAGEPVLVSYCPLCASGIVFDRRLDDQTLVFGNTSALYQSDMVKFDHQTGSYWFQVAGEGVVGELAGERLQVLPSMMATWEDWKTLHPDTLVLLPEAGGHELRVYQRDVFAGYEERVNQGDFAFPVSEAARSDRRLNPGDHVLAIGTGDQARAYPLGDGQPLAYNDVVDGQPVVVMVGPGPSAAAFIASVDGRPLTFVASTSGYVDQETGSSWDMAGRAKAGPLQGAALEPLPTRRTLWFALVAAEPDVILAP